MTTRDPWTIYPGRAAEVPAALALWRESQALPTETDTELALRRLLDRDPDSLLLAEVEGEIVGSLICAWDGWRGSFYRLTVHPTWRRRGVATALVRAGEGRLRELGALKLTAIVASEDEGAAAFWEAAGYRCQAARSRFVRMLNED
jgi:ribosomal protein S18 acetylase RimI-like enzyme